MKKHFKLIILAVVGVLVLGSLIGTGMWWFAKSSVSDQLSSILKKHLGEDTIVEIEDSNMEWGVDTVSFVGVKATTPDNRVLTIANIDLTEESHDIFSIDAINVSYQSLENFISVGNVSFRPSMFDQTSYDVSATNLVVNNSSYDFKSSGLELIDFNFGFVPKNIKLSNASVSGEVWSWSFNTALFSFITDDVLSARNLSPCVGCSFSERLYYRLEDFSARGNKITNNDVIFSMDSFSTLILGHDNLGPNGIDFRSRNILVSGVSKDKGIGALISGFGINEINGDFSFMANRRGSEWRVQELNLNVPDFGEVFGRLEMVLTDSGLSLNEFSIRYIDSSFLTRISEFLSNSLNLSISTTRRAIADYLLSFPSVRRPTIDEVMRFIERSGSATIDVSTVNPIPISEIYHSLSSPSSLSDWRSDWRVNPIQ